jgi:hypothetical protein
MERDLPVPAAGCTGPPAMTMNACSAPVSRENAQTRIRGGPRAGSADEENETAIGLMPTRGGARTVVQARFFAGMLEQSMRGDPDRDIEVAQVIEELL